MINRVEMYRRFSDRFHAGKRLRPATDDQIGAAEAALGVSWPESYRQFALTCGAVWSPSLIDLIARHEPGFSDVQQFLTAKQSVTETRRWRSKPTGACLVFASDCSGNWFAFRDIPASPTRPDDAPVWLFDLEDDTVEMEATSFDEWVKRFLKL